MPLSEEQRCLLALHLVSGIGPRLTRSLLERFGTARDVLAASVAELMEVPFLGRKTAEQVHRALQSGDVDAEIQRAADLGVDLRFLGEPDFPAPLAEIPDPPTLLYVKGTILPADDRAIALVGSRHCTAYGKKQAQRLGADLARAGWTVVSGLARGIDGCAHRGALEGGGRTLAVLAGGLARIYPPEHADLAAEVAQRGALISETCLPMEPMPGMFPARNRILSGLCRAVVVVEAAEKSGALITARHALEQGREVFALPGPVDSPASGGTLHLLREGAGLIRHARDLLEDLEGKTPLGAPGEDPPPPAVPPNLNENEQAAWEFLAAPRHADEIARHLQQPAGALAGLLMGLELRKVLRRLPGNRYERW